MRELTMGLVNDRTIVLSGRLDARSADATRAALHDLVDAGDGELVVGLGDLEIYDRAGLGVIVGVARRARIRGRGLALTDVGRREERLLLAAGVGRIARISADLTDEASLVGA